MKLNNTSPIRIIFPLALMIVYFLIVWQVLLPLLESFADPKINNFESYHRLYNWDLKSHAVGDFDGDGKTDIITFTGCAFLSSVDKHQILADDLCTATGIVQMYTDTEDPLGQKFIDTNESDLNLNSKGWGTHSYLAKKPNQNWIVYINTNGHIKAFKLVAGEGLHQATEAITWSILVDEMLYFVSKWSFLILLPIVPILFMVWLWKKIIMHQHETIQ